MDPLTEFLSNAQSLPPEQAGGLATLQSIMAAPPRQEPMAQMPAQMAPVTSQEMGNPQEPRPEPPPGSYAAHEPPGQVSSALATPGNVLGKFYSDQEAQKAGQNLQGAVNIAFWQSVGQGKTADFMNSSAGRMFGFSLKQYMDLIRKTSVDNGGVDPLMEGVITPSNMLALAHIQKVDTEVRLGKRPPKDLKSVMEKYPGMSSTLSDPRAAASLAAFTANLNPLIAPLLQHDATVQTIQGNLQAADKQTSAQLKAAEIQANSHKYGIDVQARLTQQELANAAKKIDLERLHTGRQIRNLDEEFKRIGVRAQIDKINAMTGAANAASAAVSSELRPIHEALATNTALARLKTAQLVDVNKFLRGMDPTLNTGEALRKATEARALRGDLDDLGKERTTLVGQIHGVSTRSGVPYFMEQMRTAAGDMGTATPTKEQLGKNGPGASEIFYPKVPPVIDAQGDESYPPLPEGQEYLSDNMHATLVKNFSAWGKKAATPDVAEIFSSPERWTAWVRGIPLPSGVKLDQDPTVNYYVARLLYLKVLSNLRAASTPAGKAKGPGGK